MMRYIKFLAVILLMLTGCSQHSLGPKRAFLDVKRDVCERTNENICWNEQPSYQFDQWLDEALENPLTVHRAIQIVLLNSPELKASYASLGVAQAQLIQAGLLQNPLFSASLKYENLA